MTRQVALEDVVLNVTTWNPLKTSEENSFDYIDISSVGQESKTIESPKQVFSAEAPSRARQLVKADDVIVSTVRPNLNAIAQVPAFLDGATASTGFCVLRSDAEKLDSRFLFHWVKSPQFVDDMTLKATGASYPAVSDRIIKESKIPLPPLPEQRRIAAILDKADALREKRRQSIAKLDALLQSVFIDMFGDPVTNPMGWPMSSIGDEVSLMEYGPRFYNEAYTPSGIRIVRITDLDSLGNLDFESMPRMDVSNKDIEKYCLSAGELIFARSGATVGKVAFIKKTDPECIAGAYFIRMRFKENIHPLFARTVISSKSIQAIIVNRSRQSAQQNFSGPGIRSLPLPVPPIELQLKFERNHSAISELAKCEYQHVMAADKLFQSLQQRAFTGEL